MLLTAAEGVQAGVVEFPSFVGSICARREAPSSWLTGKYRRIHVDEDRHRSDAGRDGRMKELFVFTARFNKAFVFESSVFALPCLS